MKKVRLAEYIELFGDGIHGTPTYDESGEFLFINGNNLENGKIVADKNTLAINRTEYEKIKRPLTDRTILLSINGTLGKTAFYNGENIALGKSVCYINIKPGYSKEFFRYVLTTKEFQRYMHTVAHGSTIKNFAPSQVGEFEIALPPENEWCKIAKILTAIDEKLANNAAICAELEGMAKLIYDSWFVQFDFPDEYGRPYKTSGGPMVWNPTLRREIPQGWEVAQVGELFTTERGISYSTPNIQSDQGVPMMNLATFMPGGGDYKHEGLKHYSGDYPKNKVLAPYDLIMCNTQQTAIKFETDIIGRAMLVPDLFEGDIVFSHHVNVIRTHNDCMKFLLLYFFNSDSFHKYISGFTNGTNILGLDFRGVEDCKITIPPLPLLEKFAAIVSGIAKQKDLLASESQHLAALRDFLLPLLMNGQVRVGGGGAH